MTELASLNRWEDLVPVAAEFARCDERRQQVHLDLSPLDRDGNAGRRLDVLSVALLANLLVGRYTDVPLEITWPTSSSICGQLRRGGVPFALAQRVGPVTFIDGNGSVPTEGWNGSWRPAFGDSLFDAAEADHIDERLYFYANTHRLGEGHFRSYQPAAAMPWLGQLVPVPRDTTARQVRNSFVVSTVEAIVEVLENLATHAAKLRQPLANDWLRPHSKRAKSALICSLTRGGGKDSWDRLHVLALDNGYGIGRTLRWQHPDAKLSTPELIDAVLRRKFLERNIPGHAGRGLWYLHGLARIAGGSARVVTEEDEADHHCAVQLGFESPAAEDGPTKWRDPERIDLPIRGTILVLDLDVPSVYGDVSAGKDGQYRDLRDAPVANA